MSQFFADTFGNGNNEKKEAPVKKKKIVDPDEPFKLKGESEHAGPKATPDSVLEMLEFLGTATPETRNKVKELAEQITSEELLFHRVFVKKGEEEGDYFADEDQAMEEWGAEGYTLVFRLITGKKLGRVASKEEHEKLIKLESARKRKQREAADKAKKDA